MEKDHKVWKFYARAKKIYLPNDSRADLIVNGFSIGSHHYEDAVVATGFSFFAQVPTNDFETLREEGLITRVEEAEDYLRNYKGIQVRQDFLYAFEKIGLADVRVDGADHPLGFQNVAVTSGHGKLLGMGFLGNLEFMIYNDGKGLVLKGSKAY